MSIYTLATAFGANLLETNEVLPEETMRIPFLSTSRADMSNCRNLYGRLASPLPVTNPGNFDLVSIFIL